MNYLIGLFCFLFIAAFSSQTLVDICDTIMVGTTIYFVIKNKDYSWNRALNPKWLFWISWIFVVFLGLYLNHDEFSWVNFLEFRWFFSFFAMIYLLGKIQKMDLFIRSMTATTLALNVIALFLYFIRHDPRAAGISNAIMAFSQNMGIVTCFFITYLICSYRFNNELITKNKTEKMILYSLCLTSVVLVLLTLTRGVWLAVAVAVAITSYLIHKRFFIYSLLSILIVSGSVMSFSPSFKQRLFSQNSDSQTSNNQRKNLWRANIEMVKDYPLFGVGYSLNKERLDEYYKKLDISDDEFRAHAHNQYIHFASGTGLIGLSFYLVFLFSIFKKLFTSLKWATDKTTKSTVLALISALVSFCVASLTESNFSISKNRLFFLFFCALSVSIYKILNSDRSGVSNLNV